MDKNPLLSKLNKTVPGAVLETRRFGRSSVTSVWIEAQSIQKVAEALKNDSALKLDWLENMSVVEFEGALVITYFVRSTFTQHNAIIRLSVVPPSEGVPAILPSVQTVWLMSLPFEQEAQEMFGVQFQLGPPENAPQERQAFRLPEGWAGFPLRKNYVFPKEFFGVPHSRSFNNSANRKKNDP